MPVLRSASYTAWQHLLFSSESRSLWTGLHNSSLRRYSTSKTLSLTKCGKSESKVKHCPSRCGFRRPICAKLSQHFNGSDEGDEPWHPSAVSTSSFTARRASP